MHILFVPSSQMFVLRRMYNRYQTTQYVSLQTNEPHNTEAVKVELAGVQSMLGIQSGGADALVALSLLCGGDYAIKGAEHVGSRSAVKLLQYLLEPHQVPHSHFSLSACKMA